MGQHKVCVIGAGNITNTRHIPALKKQKGVEIIGVISDLQDKITRTQKNYPFLKNTFLLDKNIDLEKQLRNCEWFMDEVDSVVIGTPPHEHYSITVVCLRLKKHVFIEKPMAMNAEEAKDMLETAMENGCVLNVMHSFQFSNGIQKMYCRYKNGEFGKLQSINEIQLTNRARRLPKWYNELPLGLFYDEAAHFVYCARRFGGKLELKNASAQFNDNGENTPCLLQAQLRAGGIPVQMTMNFNSPICEWGLILCCEKKIAIYDFFKDILIVISNDNQHLAKDVLRVSLGFSGAFWKGFVLNGVRMARKSLLFGQDVCMNKFFEEIDTGKKCYELSPELGVEVVEIMNDIVRECAR